jgi:hypothetical protein
MHLGEMVRVSLRIIRGAIYWHSCTVEVNLAAHARPVAAILYKVSRDRITTSLRRAVLAASGLSLAPQVISSIGATSQRTACDPTKTFWYRTPRQRQPLCRPRPSLMPGSSAFNLKAAE